MKLIVQGVLQTRHTRVNIKTIRDFQGLQTMDPPGLPAQDISHATSINSYIYIYILLNLQIYWYNCKFNPRTIGSRTDYWVKILIIGASAQ